MRYLILALSLAMPFAVPAQAPVCWKNAQGVTECGNHPPPGVDTRAVKAPRAATATDDDAGGDSIAERAIAEQRCRDARATLEQYRRADYLYELDDAGEQRLLSAEQTAAAKAEAERVAAERCAGMPGT